MPFQFNTRREEDGSLRVDLVVDCDLTTSAWAFVICWQMVEAIYEGWTFASCLCLASSACTTLLPPLLRLAFWTLPLLVLLYFFALYKQVLHAIALITPASYNTHFYRPDRPTPPPTPEISNPPPAPARQLFRLGRSLLLTSQRPMTSTEYSHYKTLPVTGKLHTTFPRATPHPTYWKPDPPTSDMLRLGPVVVVPISTAFAPLWRAQGPLMEFPRSAANSGTRFAETRMWEQRPVGEAGVYCTSTRQWT